LRHNCIALISKCDGHSFCVSWSQFRVVDRVIFNAMAGPSVGARNGNTERSEVRRRTSFPIDAPASATSWSPILWFESAKQRSKFCNVSRIIRQRLGQAKALNCGVKRRLNGALPPSFSGRCLAEACRRKGFGRASCCLGVPADKRMSQETVVRQQANRCQTTAIHYRILTRRERIFDGFV
jgi:hypothetical protein